jgi:hypothetical protein
MTRDFRGASRPLTADGMRAAMESLAVGASEIWTLLAVETNGCGFLPDRRPPILFERHIFSKLTDRRFDVCDVSDPTPGGYGAPGAHQYERLAEAIEKNRTAALQSASWGMAQIMGQNFAAAGFRDVESMVEAMCDSEDSQLAALAAFLRSNGAGRHLRTHDWALLAKSYNGPNYAGNQYQARLAAMYETFSNGPLPDLTIRAAQMYLTFAGLEPGAIDGRMGNRTQAALAAFQSSHRLPPTGLSDDVTISSLVSSI